ncbi:hypothetical protein [Nostoc sp. CCY0012]|uniref:hypothetical protein n=1 Tax=Nostoc sp. CCY0012 TaxID=1056123 RepID=UPI0039C61317
MSIWIITTGNSDVQLTQNALDDWNIFHNEVEGESDLKNFQDFSSAGNFIKDEMTSFYPVPARVLGIVYENHIEDNILYENDVKNAENNDKHLAFPLLNTFSEHFLKNRNNTPSLIIVLLTDQRNIFVEENSDLNEKARNIFSPFWQDTCTLKPIVNQYFQQHKLFLSTKLEFFTLRPFQQGLDNWNETLEVVKEEFKNIKNKLAEYSEYDPNETVYVSHQAGTPAISSAVQFISLSNFKNIKFLSSNIFFNDDNQPASEPQLVNISNYWMGIQIQKAKQLTLDGLPGTALAMLKEIGYVHTKDVIPRLENMVNVFNICESLTQGKDFNDVEAATQRVVDALTLIEIFFKEKNYLPGIALLAAAQETFMRAAISHAIKDKIITLKHEEVEKDFDISILIKWQELGLLFLDSADTELENSFGKLQKNDKKRLKIEILKKISFPLNHFYDDGDTEKEKFKKINFKLIKDNPALFKWLRGLQPNFQHWDLLEWICIGKRDKNEYDDDIRNGLMHNLVGFNEQEVIKYLLGNPKTSTYTDVLTTYRKEVKEKFIKEIKNLGLPYNDRNLYDELEAIANDIT